MPAKTMITMHPRGWMIAISGKVRAAPACDKDGLPEVCNLQAAGFFFLVRFS